MSTKLYLSGGMVSSWQNNITSDSYFKHWHIFDPSKHLLNSPNLYTAWDIHFINKCDILFAYMERSNPAGYGLITEIGYARALNKTIIYVDEKSASDKQFHRYTGMIREMSDAVFESFYAGLSYLKSYKTL